jgi:hypothetical protein
VDAAQFFLLVHSAELYGLVTGPTVDAARCDEILARGKDRGFIPAPTETLLKRFLQ